MEIGIIGLGRMGAHIARRLIAGGHRCVGYDRDAAAVKEAAAKDGFKGPPAFPTSIAKLTPPRILWFMLPAGAITESAISDAAKLLQRGDIVIDGGNSFYKDDIRRAKTLAGRESATSMPEPRAEYGDMTEATA